MEKITVKLIEDWHGNSTETLWGYPWFKENCYQIRNVPFYAKGISLNDIVEVEEYDDIKQLKSILKKSGHSTYRIFLEEGTSEAMFNAFWLPLEKLGCSYEKGYNRFYSVDVPSETDIYMAYSLFEDGEKNHVWNFEEGDVGHELR